MFKEFKEFAMRGNVMDLAIGVVIGGAFGAIVTSLVNDIIMPLVGTLLGRVDFKDMKTVLAPADATHPAVTLNYGIFINTIINFVIIAFSIFMVVKAINRMRRTEPEAPAEPPAPTTEERLLTEIRDAIRGNGRAVIAEKATEAEKV